jgi:CRISPR system Cascade subunit CasE
VYLSRLILDPRSRRIQRELEEPYEMHRSIMRAFADCLQAGADRILWSVDQRSATGPVLIVQSRSKPDWTWTADNGGGRYLESERGEPAVETTRLQHRLAEGQVHGFCLRANPTIKRRFAVSGDHKRIGIEAEDDQLAWLRRKADEGGFRILEVRVTREDPVKGVIRRKGARHALHLIAVRFEGLLSVTDPALLRKTLVRGLGSGKGMGFGLLSLEPGRP